MQRVAFLVGGTLLLWAVVTYPASLWIDESAWLYSSTAMALCLVPAAVTMLWLSRVAAQAGEQQLVALLGGTGLRMAVVLGVGLALTAWLPEWFSKTFLVWLVVYYLFTLFLEVRLLLPAREEGKP
jgi:hypothetical protein